MMIKINIIRKAIIIIWICLFQIHMTLLFLNTYRYYVPTYVYKQLLPFILFFSNSKMWWFCAKKKSLRKKRLNITLLHESIGKVPHLSLYKQLFFYLKHMTKYTTIWDAFRSTKKKEKSWKCRSLVIQVFLIHFLLKKKNKK